MLEVDAYNAIKKMILDGELASGTVISEAELCKKLEMSRTPVRVALNRLDIEGYITQSKGRFSTVRTLTSEDICNLFQFALIVEEYIIRWLYDHPEEIDFKKAQETIDRQIACVKAGDSYGAMANDHAFHMVLYNSLENSQVSERMENAWNITQLGLNPRVRRNANTLGAESVIEHTRLLSCLKAWAPIEETLDAIRTHNENARNRMLIQ